jgi:hypothetical protein
LSLFSKNDKKLCFYRLLCRAALRFAVLDATCVKRHLPVDKLLAGYHLFESDFPQLGHCFTVHETNQFRLGIDGKTDLQINPAPPQEQRFSSAILSCCGKPYEYSRSFSIRTKTHHFIFSKNMPGGF